MTEILIDVDFGHPPERVWRALTDRAVLSEWFMQTDLEPYVGRRFRLMPDGLLGLAGPMEGELIEVSAPRRLVMLWRGEQLHSRVTWELVPLPDGCRLRMSHTGFIGVKGSLRRKELQRTYDRMLSDRLPRVLDGLASGRAVRRDAGTDLGADLAAPAAAAAAAAAASADPPADPPAERPVAPARPKVPVLADPSASDALGGWDEAAERPGPDRHDGDGEDGEDRSPRTGVMGWIRTLPHRRRGQLLAAAAAVLLAVVTFAVISGLNVPGFVPPLGASPGDWPTASPGAGPTGAGRPTPAPGGAGEPGARPSASPPTAVRPGVLPSPGGVAPGPATPQAPPGEEPGGPPPPVPPPAAPASWVATYRTVSSTDAGFVGRVTVTNTGGSPARDWTVAVSLPAGADLQTVSNANGSQSGGTVTFTARDARKIPQGDSLTFEFEVRGASGPTGCRVSGDACGGL